MSSDNTGRPAEVVSSASSRIEALEAGLADEFRNAMEEIDNKAMNAEASVYPLLERTLTLHELLLQRGRSEWEQWLRAHGIDLRKAGGRVSENDEFWTLKAVYHEEDRKKRKRTISLQGQALAYYRTLNPADRRPLATWLETKEKVGGKLVSGVAKGAKLYSDTPDSKDRKTTKAAARRTEKETIVADLRADLQIGEPMATIPDAGKLIEKQKVQEHGDAIALIHLDPDCITIVRVVTQEPTLVDEMLFVAAKRQRKSRVNHDSADDAGDAQESADEDDSENVRSRFDAAYDTAERDESLEDPEAEKDGDAEEDAKKVEDIVPAQVEETTPLVAARVEHRSPQNAFPLAHENGQINRALKELGVESDPSHVTLDQADLAYFAKRSAIFREDGFEANERKLDKAYRTVEDYVRLRDAVSQVIAENEPMTAAEAEIGTGDLSNRLDNRAKRGKRLRRSKLNPP